MANVLITGASGFIGSFLVEEGLKRGYRVYAGIRKSSSKKYLQDKRIEFFYLNLSSKDELIQELLKKKKEGIFFDYIVHNAGITKPVNKNDFFKVNFEGTKNLVDALIESDLIPQKFLYISSLDAFGAGDEKSMKPVSEKDSPKPFSLYGKSKLASEQYLQSLKNFPYLIFRPTGVYGPKEKDYFTVIKTISHNLEIYIISSNQALSLLYVKDLANAVFLGLESDKLYKAYFISDGNSYTSGDLGRIIKKILKKKTIKIIIPNWFIKYVSLLSEKITPILNKPALLNADKYKMLTSMNWLCDSSLIQKELDFKPEYNLEQGLKDSIKWYKKNKWIK